MSLIPRFAPRAVVGACLLLGLTPGLAHAIPMLTFDFSFDGVSGTIGGLVDGDGSTTQTAKSVIVSVPSAAVAAAAPSGAFPVEFITDPIVGEGFFVVKDGILTRAFLRATSGDLFAGTYVGLSITYLSVGFGRFELIAGCPGTCVAGIPPYTGTIFLGDAFATTIPPVAAVPSPAPLSLFVAGLMAFGVRRKWFKGEALTARRALTMTVANGDSGDVRGRELEFTKLLS